MTRTVEEQVRARAERRLAVSNDDRPWRERWPHDLESVRLRLVKATQLAEGILLDEPADPTTHPDYVRTKQDTGILVPNHHLGHLAELWEQVERLQNALPHVECWCVVKLYRDGNGAGGTTWQPTTWTGHVEREQAERFAPVIAAHYASKAPAPTRPAPEDAPGYAGGWGDRFAVAWAAADIRDVVNPNLSPQEYVRGLGS